MRVRLTSYLTIALLVALVAFTTHLKFINNGFVWLDHADIEQKRAIIPLSSWRQIFFSRYGETGYYRPSLTLFHSFNYFLFGLNPTGYHLTSVLIHTLVSLLAVIFFKRYFMLSGLPLFVAGLVVAVHPLSWFTVGTITSAQELLLVFFMLSALIAYHSLTVSKITHKMFLWVVWIISCLAALWSKETALILLPGTVAVVEITRQQNKTKLRPQGKQALLLSLIVLLALYSLLRLIAVPEVWKSAGTDLSFSQAVGTRFASITRTLSALLYPSLPSFSDTTQVVAITHPSSLAGILIILAIISLIIANGLRSYLSRALFLLLLFLLPFLNLIPLPRFWFPNYAYILIIASAAAIGCSLNKLQKKFSWYFLGLIVTVLLVTIMAQVTYRAGSRFKNDEILFLPEVNREPQYREGHFYLGTYYWQRSQSDKAEYHLDKSLQDNPRIISFIDRPAAMINRAGVYKGVESTESAKLLLAEVIKNSQGTNKLLASYNLALIFSEEKDYQKVTELLAPNYSQSQRPEPWLLYIKTLLLLNRTREAQEVALQAERIFGPQIFTLPD